MELLHPFIGVRRELELDDEVRAYVASIPLLPQVECPAPYVKPRWKAWGLIVPPGTYSDPSTPAAERAVEGLYHALKGRKITRQRVALALNFQSADQVDSVRARLYKEGAPIWRGAPGVSVHSTKPVEDVIAVQARRRKAKVA